MDLALFLVILSVVGYFVLMVFFPEWVGITGKKAKKNIDSHKSGSETKDHDEI